MARRKRKRPTRAAKIDDVAHKHLPELREALGTQGLPTYVDDFEVLSALVLYTTTPQLAGMLREYWRYTKRLSEEQDEASEEVSDGDAR